MSLKEYLELKFLNKYDFHSNEIFKKISKNFNKLCKYLLIFELNRFRSNISISKYKFRDLIKNPLCLTNRILDPN